MRYLMRSNATHGSASFANIPGYYVGGKTGTADKIIHGHYSQDKVFTTFMAITPGRQAEISVPRRSTTIRRPRPRMAATIPPPTTPAASPAR